MVTLACGEKLDPRVKPGDEGVLKEFA